VWFPLYLTLSYKREEKARPGEHNKNKYH
jgi:hypothetical protein